MTRTSETGHPLKCINISLDVHIEWSSIFIICLGTWYGQEIIVSEKSMCGNFKTPHISNLFFGSLDVMYIHIKHSCLTFFFY